MKKKLIALCKTQDIFFFSPSFLPVTEAYIDVVFKLTKLKYK